MKDEEHLAEQFTLLFKNIWYHENSRTEVKLNNTNVSEQFISEELHLKIFSTKSKIAYLQVN